MYKISFNLKSFNLPDLARTDTYLLSIFSFFNIDQVKHQINPKKCKKITVLRSPHIDKKSREHFQIVNHKKTLLLEVSDKNLFLLLIEILKNSKIRGVEVEMVVEFSTH